MKISPKNIQDLAAARAGIALALAISLITTIGGGMEAKSSAPTCPYYNPTDNAFVHKYLKPGQYMPLSEIKPGMVGYGLTVFHGVRIERFKVEVISVIKQVLNGRDAILARLSGGEMGKNAVIKGMSGSPCYINGKLIGAVSFGFDFEKEPIAGITPIVDMLDAVTDGVPVNNSIAHLQAPSWSINPASAGITNVSGGALHMIPLVSPVSLVGFSPRAEQFLSDRFKNIGMGVTSGSAGGIDPSLSGGEQKDLKPGSAIGVLLTSGDFTIAATGTVTARFADKVIAFGHPFMQGGSIDFPMSTAFVHQVMPSLAVSFKMASPVNVVGSVTSDRPWGIGGKVGRLSHMIPATYTVIDETRHVQQTYHCNVINHPDMTPDLLAATATSALDATHQTNGPYIAKVESRIEADGIAPIVRTDRFASGMAAKSILDLFGGGDPVGKFVQKSTDQLANNDFQKASIKNVSLKITLQDGHQTAKIDRVYLDKSFAAPGEDVNVTAVLKPFNQEPVQETMTFKVPRDIPDGTMLIGVAGGHDYDYIKGRLGIVDPEPENLKQIAQKIQNEGRGDQISVVVGLPEQSLMLNGTKLINPPAYWTKVFFSNRHTKGPTLAKGEMKVVKDEPWMLFNSHILALEVRSPDKAAARSAPYPISAPYNNDDVAITEQARKALETVASNSKKGRTNRGGSQSAGIVVTSSTTMIPVTGTTGTTTASNTTNSSTEKAATESILTATTGSGYPHVRPLQIWRQDCEDDFKPGKMKDATVDSWGRLSPGFESLADKQVSSEDQIWSGTFVNGSFYYGSGDTIWRWQPNAAKPEKVAKLDGLFIPALAADTQGTIYATAVPSGKIWRIDTKAPGANASVIFTASEPIITSLAVDEQGHLFAGTAGTGKVYKIDCSRSAGNKNAQVVFDSAQAHVLCLFYGKADDTLYVGTGEKGSVYTLAPDGSTRAIYQSPDHFITGIAKNSKGDLYVASAGAGHLVKVSPSGEATTLASSDAFYTLHYDEHTDSIFSGDAEGDITMACFDPVTRQPYFMPVSHTEQEAVLALASDGDKLYAGTSNLAVLRAFAMRLSSKPLYISAVKDGGKTAQWSNIRIYGPFNETSTQLNAKLKIETRTGQTAKPDATWSDWTQARSHGQGFILNSAPGRYFQYRLSWNTQADALGPEKIDRLDLGRIDTIFLPANSQPQISTISLKSGSAVNEKLELSMTGTDADGDNLLASIDISADGGTTWKPLKDDLRSKSGTSGAGKNASSAKDDDDKDRDDESSNARQSASDDKSSNKEETDADGAGKDTNQNTDKDKSQNEDANKTAAPTIFRQFLRRLDDSLAGESKESAPAGKSAQETEKKADKEEKSEKSDRSEKIESSRAKKKKETKPSGGGQSRSSSSSNKSSETGASTESFTYNWDTAKTADGSYLIRFTVDDRLSNPSGNASIVNVRSVTVDNTAPEIALIEYARKAGGEIEFKVTAKDKISSIANATYKLDDGEPFALSFTPESMDSLNATLIATDVKVTPGTHKVEVKVSDRAGNTATKTISVK